MEFLSLSAAVLAGGKGERMSNQDKGLLWYRGEPMAQAVGRALHAITDCVFINANRNLDSYVALGFDVVSDRAEHQGKGPLSGLLACLAFAKTSHLLVSPCDTPCISGQAFEKLKQAAQQQPDNIHYLRNSSGRHPLHAILPVESCLNALHRFLSSDKGYSVMAFYEAHGSASVLWEKPDELLNINTREYLENQ